MLSLGVALLTTIPERHDHLGGIDEGAPSHVSETISDGELERLLALLEDQNRERTLERLLEREKLIEPSSTVEEEVIDDARSISRY